MTASTPLMILLRKEQRARWHLGDRVLVESFLDLHPQLQRDADAVLDLIWSELRLRHERGDTPQLAEYVQRFGRHEARLVTLFQMYQGLDSAGQTRVGAPTAVQSFAVDFSPSLATEEEIPAPPGYEIVGELGRGGMGVVYQARQLSLKRLVALKMILAGPFASSTMRTRFRTEAEAAARLQHANIVQIHEIGEYDGRPFLSLEHVDGGSLKQKTAGVPQTEPEAARLVETLARAVHYTHQHGILHRDLNPNNVLLTADGTPKITDFGLAKLMDAEGGPTRTEAFIGTPSYVSPEQAAGDSKKIGVPADVYSLGAILYELLTGRPPFQGTTVQQTLEQVRSQEPVAPRRIRIPVSVDLETICLKCLEKNPARRYASAEALADDLHRFVEGQPIQARPIPPWQRLGRSAWRRPKLVAGIVGAALLAGLLLVSWSYFRAKGQLASHRAEEKYQQFVQRRDDAHFYGLLSAEQGAYFLGYAGAANLNAAESAALEALALAGIDATSQTTVAPDFPAARQAEAASDCYSLLLLLANIRGQQPVTEQDRKRHVEESLRLLDRAGKLGFQTRACHLRRASLLERLNDHQQEAKKEREWAYSLPLQDAQDYFLLGEEQYRRGDWEEARESFQRALVLQPTHFWAQFFLAISHLKSQEWTAARVGLNACITQHPDFVWAYLFRSFADEKLKALPEAKADFQKALQLNPNKDARYVLYLTRGNLYFKQEEWTQAAANFQSAQALKPDQYNAYMNLAQVYLAQGQFEQADEMLDQALRLRPPVQVVFSCHLEHGRHLLRKEKPQDAIAACDAAIELCPERPQPHEVRARALLALGNYEQAEQSFDEYVRKGGLPASIVYRGRGLARMKLGKYPKAAEDYGRALERGPDADLYQHRGWALFFSQAPLLAELDFSEALKRDPDLGDAYVGRGLSHVAQGHYREAVADADAALNLKPRTPEMMHNVACIFAQSLAKAAADGEGPDQQTFMDSCCRQALTAVEQTLQLLPQEERGAFFREKILPDQALASIHEETRFKRLEEEYRRPK